MFHRCFTVNVHSMVFDTVDLSYQVEQSLNGSGAAYFTHCGLRDELARPATEVSVHRRRHFPHGFGRAVDAPSATVAPGSTFKELQPTSWS
jgi:hypothetical protein